MAAATTTKTKTTTATTTTNKTTNMADLVVIDPNLTRADRIVVEGLIRDIRSNRDYDKEKSENRDGAEQKDGREEKEEKEGKEEKEQKEQKEQKERKHNDIEIPDDEADLARLDGMNDPNSSLFETTVFTGVDRPGLLLSAAVSKARKTPGLRGRLQAAALTGLQQVVLEPYVKMMQRYVVRHPTDVVFATHLLVYLGGVVPSAALLLFWRFTWMHAVAHLLAVLGGCVGAYTIMMHQHIHQGGVLRRDRWWTRAVDTLFPYVLDPLMGHTWNSYYYHHVKHHHVEGNGPDDLSSTMRYRRDGLWDFGCYFVRFLLLVWLELPRYFYQTKRYRYAVRAGSWEIASYVFVVSAVWHFGRAAVLVFVVPLAIMRLGLMLGNWGQHALVDPVDPASDFRSSITLIDVASNRVCFNDGYHTSHHLHPRRHWRDHPNAFVRQKATYAREHALVFVDTDYLGLTIRLILLKDYDGLAKRLVPLGPQQQAMTLAERAQWLRRLTEPFSEEDIARTFPKSRSARNWRRKQGLSEE